MKKLYMIVALVLISVSALAQSGRDLYNKYSDQPGVEAVYISPAMFRMIGRIPDIEFNNSEVDFSPLIKSMTGFYLLSTTEPTVKDILAADVRNYVNSGRYELLMEAKESGDVMRMYTMGDETTVTSFVMLANEGDEVSFISFDGKMDRALMEQLLAEAAAE